jgi:hypothetical protein
VAALPRVAISWIEERCPLPAAFPIARFRLSTNSAAAFGARSHAKGTEMNRPKPIPELTEVALKRAIDRRGVHMPAGARGVVMASYADGLAYEVEFEAPAHIVLTLEGADLQA